MSEETAAAKTPGQIACDAWFDTSAPQDVAWDNAAEAVAAPLRARIGELEAMFAAAVDARDHFDAAFQDANERGVEFGEKLDTANARIGELEALLADCQRKNAALADAGIRKHDAVCRLVDLFSGPDDRRMRHASVTDATIKRYCADAGIRDAPAYDVKES